jgi:hypothetical protein
MLITIPLSKDIKIQQVTHVTPHNSAEKKFYWNGMGKATKMVNSTIKSTP